MKGKIFIESIGINFVSQKMIVHRNGLTKRFQCIHYKCREQIRTKNITVMALSGSLTVSAGVQRPVCEHAIANLEDEFFNSQRHFKFQTLNFSDG